MSKHTLSSAPLPPAKRLRTSAGLSDSFLGRSRSSSLDDTLSDELVICIFSYLSWADLCTVQATNRNWCRLAADNELWRKLYLKVYGRSRLRGASGFLTRPDGKEMKPLPGGEEPTVFRDWKWMFRISSNWRRGAHYISNLASGCTLQSRLLGRCVVEQLDSCLSSSTVSVENSHQPLILLAGSLVIAASSRPSDQPTIEISNPSSIQHTLYCGSQRRDNAFQITALAIDQSPPSLGYLRIVSFFSTGGFTIFSINTAHLPASSVHLTYCPNRGNLNSSPIIQAAYHHPLLVALSHTFNLVMYDLSNGTIKHIQTLTSFTSFPPTSLVLSTPTPTAYKLVLEYAIPVYPAHWSVGATELVISGAGISSTPTLLSLPSTLSAAFPAVNPMRVLSIRTTRAIDIPQGWADKQKIHSMREQWGRKVSRVADTQTDGKWIVLAPAEEPSFLSSSGTTPSSMSSAEKLSNSSTTLQLYRLYLPARSTSIATSPKLIFVRNLHGHIGPISSLALADGRCVSLGQNGSVWVWDLEAAVGTEVSVSRSENAGIDNGLIQGAVAFDDRRIVTMETTGVVMRRFDV